MNYPSTIMNYPSSATFNGSIHSLSDGHLTPPESRLPTTVAGFVASREGNQRKQRATELPGARWWSDGSMVKWWLMDHLNMLMDHLMPKSWILRDLWLRRGVLCWKLMVEEINGWRGFWTSGSLRGFPLGVKGGFLGSHGKQGMALVKVSTKTSFTTESVRNNYVQP